MPRNRTFSLMLCTFPYSGNSTGSSICWPAAEWLIKTCVRLKTEEKFTSRIHQVAVKAISDTPITMCRNHIVKEARQAGIDLLLMLDSDMTPDVHLGQYEDIVPFIDVAFDRIYAHWDKGPLVIAAPYGGSPPWENQFQFSWRRLASVCDGVPLHMMKSGEAMGDEAPFKLDQFTREECMRFSGIHKAAALPTGLILYDMRCFDLIEPPYFSYEWEDETASKKASTEDVQNTRDISLAGCQQLGYNPCEVAWSSWAGHNKNWTVGRPMQLTEMDVSKNLARALTRRPRTERRVDLTNMLGDMSRLFPEKDDAQGIESPSRVRSPAAAGEVQGECCPHSAGENGAGAGNGQAAEAQKVKVT